MESESTVYINVYDILLTKNNFTSQFGLGFYHTGVEIYGKEYSFAGGQPFKSGIYAIEPKQATRSRGDKLRLHKSIKIGRTHYSQHEVDDIIEKLGHEFRTDDYSVTNNNCNHFCDTFCEQLTGKRLPNWVNRTATMTSKVPLSNQVAHFFYKKALKKFLEQKADKEKQ